MDNLAEPIAVGLDTLAIERVCLRKGIGERQTIRANAEMDTNSKIKQRERERENGARWKYAERSCCCFLSLSLSCDPFLFCRLG